MESGAEKKYGGVGFLVELECLSVAMVTEQDAGSRRCCLLRWFRLIVGSFWHLAAWFGREVEIIGNRRSRDVWLSVILFLEM